MARVCVCCEHPQRTAIEAQLVSGRSLRAVAADFGLRPAALHRHAQNHLSASLGASAQAHYSASRCKTELRSEAYTLTVLQPVAPDALTERSSSTPPRALQIEDGGPALPSPTCTLQYEEGSGAQENQTSAISAAPSAPLDPYALACELRDSAVQILRSASASGDAKLALDANRAAVNVLDRLARLMPRVGDSSSPPLQLSPEWARLRSALMTALGPFAEARIAVAEVLAETEALQ